MSEWDAYRKTARRAEGRAAFAGKGSRPYVARARELEADPDLDADAKKTLTGFLKQYDEVRPEIVRRTRQLFSQWNAVRALAKSRGVGRFIPPESEAVVEGMRKLAAEHPEHLSVKQKEMFETIAAEYDEHAERQRQWVMDHEAVSRTRPRLRLPDRRRMSSGGRRAFAHTAERLQVL